MPETNAATHPSMPASAPQSLRGISSMATRLLLAELCQSYAQRSGVTLAFESVGGVDAAKRVQAGEVFDIVALASDAIDKLIAAHLLDGATKVDLVRSGVAVAIPAGAAPVAIDSEDAVRQAVLNARSISYSTGPSGVALVQQFARWGISEAIADRIVQAPPGVPVGSLVASGEVALGFQQLSELIHVPGIQLLGPLPDAIQITTIFSAAVSRNAPQAAAALAALQFLSAPETADAKRRQGMDPA